MVVLGSQKKADGEAKRKWYQPGRPSIACWHDHSTGASCRPMALVEPNSELCACDTRINTRVLWNMFESDQLPELNPRDRSEQAMAMTELSKRPSRTSCEMSFPDFSPKKRPSGLCCAGVLSD